MQYVKIHIPDQANVAEVTLEIARRGRIDDYRDDVYVVPESALEVLKRYGVTYTELGRGGFDYAQKTLRDALANQTQRRPAGRSRKAQKNPR